MISALTNTHERRRNLRCSYTFGYMTSRPMHSRRHPKKSALYTGLSLACPLNSRPIRPIWAKSTWHSSPGTRARLGPSPAGPRTRTARSRTGATSDTAPPPSAEPASRGCLSTAEPCSPTPGSYPPERGAGPTPRHDRTPGRADGGDHHADQLVGEPAGAAVVDQRTGSGRIGHLAYAQGDSGDRATPGRRAAGAARVPVFLLDQHQEVRPGEMGTAADIKAYAAAKGLTVHQIDLQD